MRGLTGVVRVRAGVPAGDSARAKSVGKKWPCFQAFSSFFPNALRPLAFPCLIALLAPIEFLLVPGSFAWDLIALGVLFAPANDQSCILLYDDRRPACRTWQQLVGSLDWLRRVRRVFWAEPGEGAAPADSAARKYGCCLITPAGKVLLGTRAVRRLLVLLPAPVFLFLCGLRFGMFGASFFGAVPAGDMMFFTLLADLLLWVPGVPTLVDRAFDLSGRRRGANLGDQEWLMNWTLVREIGIDYAPDDSRGAEALSHPVFAERCPDGHRLIVDELGIEKALPVRHECRTLLVQADGRPVFDTRDWGFPDAYGQCLGDSQIALLRRTIWEIWITTPQGAVVKKLGLSAVSKHLPRSLWWTPWQTFLVVFLDGVHEVDVAELDRRGRLLWRLPQRDRPPGCSGSLQRLPDGNLIYADEFRHVVAEIDWEGQTVWQYGRAGEPATEPGQVSGPKAARRTATGECLIAEGRGQRVLLVATDGTGRLIRRGDGDWFAPAFADRLADGRYLVCDAGNRMVAELDDRGRVCWQYGNPVGMRRHLSFPRSVEVGPDGAVLIADTAHNRVVKDWGGAVRALPFLGVPGLFWPRCARGSRREITWSRTGGVPASWRRAPRASRCEN